MDENTKGQLTLFAGDSLANHSVSLGSSEARKMTAHSGLKCYESYEKWSQLGSLAKMLLGSSTWNSTMCYLTWKAKATPAKHLLFHREQLSARLSGVPRWNKSSNQPRMGGMVDGVSRWMDEPEGIPRVIGKVPDRVHRLKALGNAVVPQVVEVLGGMVMEIENE